MRATRPILLIYSTEKTLRELGDKVESGIKEKIDGAIKELKDVMAREDPR